MGDQQPNQANSLDNRINPPWTNDTAGRRGFSIRNNDNSDWTYRVAGGEPYILRKNNYTNFNNQEDVYEELELERSQDTVKFTAK